MRKALLAILLMLGVMASAPAQTGPQIPLGGSIGVPGSAPTLCAAAVAMSSDANYTLAPNQYACNSLYVTSSVSLTATRNIVAPLNYGQQFTITNATTGGQSVQVIGATGAGVAVANGATMVVTSPNGTGYVAGGAAVNVTPAPQYQLFAQPNSGTQAAVAGTNITTDSTHNQMNAPIASGRYDAFKWQTTPTSNDGIANGIAAASTGGRTVAGPNYSVVENAVFPSTQSAVFDDQRDGQGNEWYHNTASQYAKNIHCLFDQRLAGNPYSNAGCNYTYLDALGVGSDEGGGVLPVAATRAVYNNSYMMGIQTDGDVYLNCFHNDDCHENTTYLQFVGENLDPDQEGIQLHGANVTEAQHVFTGTVASVTDSRHLRMTPAYGQEFAGTELVKTSATLDTGTVTALADTVGYAPLTFTSSVTHTASPGWGTFAAASPQPADPVNGTMETIVVNVLGGAFPTSGPVCIDSVGHYWFQESTASATTISGGQQTLTMPLRYPFLANTFVAAGSCAYERNTADLQTDGGGITSDPMAIIIGAPNTTDYWYYLPNGGGLMGVNGGSADGAAALPFGVTSIGSTTRNTSNLVTLTAPVSNGNYASNAYFASSPSIAMSGCSDTSLNFSAHAVAVTLGTDGQTLTFTQPSGPGTSTSATGCVVTASGLNGYTISPGARVLSISDPSVVVGYDASAAVNGYYLLDRNTAFSTGDVGATGEQPHAARLGVNTNSEYLVQQTPSYGGFASRMFNLHVNGRGGSAPGTTPFTLVNDTPWASYLGGGGLNTPGAPFQITGVWSGWGHFTAPANGGIWAQLDCPPNGCSQNFPYQVFSLGGDAGSALRFTPHTGYLEWGQQFGAINGFTVPFNGYGSTNAYSMYTNFAPDQGQGVLWKTYGFTSGGGSGVDGYADGIARDSATLDYGNIVRRYFDVAGVAGHALAIDSGSQTLTSTLPVVINCATCATQQTMPYNTGHAPSGTSGAAVLAPDSSGNLDVSENNGSFSRVCTAGNGVCGSGGATYPSGSGVPIVVSGTSWGTTVAAPTGAIVGATDTQTLTNKTVDGVSPTTFGYLDPTSSVQTQLNAKAPLASPTFTGTPAAPTASGGTNTTQLATTAFVQSAVSSGTANSPQTWLVLNGTGGTTINKLACWQNASNDSNWAISCPTTNLTGTNNNPPIVGVVTSGAGTTGLATVQYQGNVSWVCDNTVAVGDWVGPSTSVAGDCHDPVISSGANSQQINENPDGNTVLGIVITANSGAGTAAVIAMMPHSGYVQTVDGNRTGQGFAMTSLGSPFTSTSFWTQLPSTVSGSNGSASALSGGSPIDLWNVHGVGFFEINNGNSALGASGRDIVFDTLSNGYGLPPNESMRFNGSVYVVPTAANITGTKSLDVSETTGVYAWTLTGNTTLSAPTDDNPGHVVTFDIVQAASGGPYTFAWNAVFQNPPTVSTVAGSSTVARFYYDGTNYICVSGCSVGGNGSAEVVTFSATPTFSTALKTSRIVLTGNVTSFTLGAGADGQDKTLCFKQGAGPYTVAAPGNVHGFFPIGATSALWNCQSYNYNATDAIWLATSVGVINE